MRPFLVAMALCTLISVGSTTALAVNTILLDINISGLDNFDLGAFDLDVNFDDSAYEFQRYFPTDALGSITLGDAIDDSYGLYVSDSVNLYMTSILTDLSNQPSEFTLATLIFNNNDTVMLFNDLSSEFSLTINALGDASGNPIPLTVSGTQISAIPVPAAAWLLGSGLIVLVGFRRRYQG